MKKLYFDEENFKGKNFEVDREKSKKITGYASIDKPWLKHYPNNFSNYDSNNNYANYFFDSISEYGDASLLSYMDMISYNGKDLEDKALEYAKKFQAMGVKENDVVSFIFLNVPEAITMLLALNKIGAVANLIKYDETKERINQMINLTNSKYLFVSEVPEIIQEVMGVLPLKNSLEKVFIVPIMHSLGMPNSVDLNNGKVATFDKFMQYDLGNESLKEIERFKNDTAVIVYTGGTTGSAKGVQLTNGNLITMMNDLKTGDFGFSYGKSCMTILPPAIAYYLNATFGMMNSGVRDVLVPAFKIEEYPSLVDKFKPQIIISGPVLLRAIKDSKIEDFSYLEMPISGGDKLTLEEEKELNSAFAKKGAKPILQGYGSSEETAVASFNPYQKGKLGSIGIPLPNVTISIFEYQTDKEISYGDNLEGEICVTGDTIMKGYLNNEEATNSMLRKHQDGKIWAHTDDFGIMDEDGHLFHRGRAKRMITRSGNKLWLTNIEDVILSFPFVKECSAVKLQDDKESEVPVVHIVFDDNENILEKTTLIDEAIAKTYPAYYIPKYYIVKDKLPYTEVNKKLDFKALENEDIFVDSEQSGKIIYPQKGGKVKKIVRE